MAEYFNYLLVLESWSLGKKAREKERKRNREILLVVVRYGKGGRYFLFAKWVGVELYLGVESE